MADWFYGKDNAQHGPVNELEVRTLLSTGKIDEETLIWREGMADWLPVSQVPEFSSSTNLAESADGSPYSAPQSNPGAAPYTGTTPTDGLAITSLVCGILGITMCGIVTGIVAVICGHMSLKKINTSPTPFAGKGMAIAGLVMGYLSILISALVILIYIGIFAAAAASA